MWDERCKVLTFLVNRCFPSLNEVLQSEVNTENLVERGWVSEEVTEELKKSQQLPKSTISFKWERLNYIG